MNKAKYDVGDRVRVEFPKQYTVEAVVAWRAYEGTSDAWYYGVSDGDRPEFQCTEEEIIGKVSDGAALQVVAKCLPEHKYSFAEYLRDICEAAGGDCLQCKLMSLGYGFVRVGESKHVKICDALQTLLMNNHPREVANFVAGVVAFADEDDKKSED